MEWSTIGFYAKEMIIKLSIEVDGLGRRFPSVDSRPRSTVAQRRRSTAIVSRRLRSTVDLGQRQVKT